MKLCFSTLGCPEWTWGDITATAHDLGYDGFEVRGVKNEMFAPHIPQFAPERIAATRKSLADLRLCIPCLDSAAELHRASQRARTIEELTAYIALAQSLGVPYIRVMADKAIPEPGHAVDEAVVVDIAQAVAGTAEAAGVTLLIETNGWYASTERLRALLDRIGSKAFAALWDVHHPYRFFGEPPRATIDNLAGAIRHVHIKDSAAVPGGYRYRMLGYGDLPIEGFVNGLRDAGYDGYYSLEWVKRWDLTLEEPGIAFTQYIGYMRSL